MNSSTRSRGARHLEGLEPTAELVTVTPKMAGQWLETNTQNRPVRERLVNKLAGLIERGEWRVNGDTIRFDQDGNVVDGQHRLLAIVQAGQAVKTLVATGIDRDTQITMDTGATRKFGDVLKMRGEASPPYLASTLRLYWRYEHGTLRYNREEPSYEELLALLEDCPGIRESVQVAQTAGIKRLRTSRTVAGTAHFILSSIDAAEAEWFFDRLQDGAELSEDDAIRRLRDWLMNPGNTARTSSTPATTLAMYIKAWNAYIEGRDVKALRWRIGGRNPESFPVPTAA